MYLLPDLTEEACLQAVMKRTLLVAKIGAVCHFKRGLRAWAHYRRGSARPGRGVEQIYARSSGLLRQPRRAVAGGQRSNAVTEMCH